MPPQISLLKPEHLSKKPAKHVENFDQIRVDAYRMLESLDRGIIIGNERVGAIALSHAQVSQEPFNFFVIDSSVKQYFKYRIIINPKIVHQETIVPFEEGCMSFVNRPHFKTERFRYIDVEWQHASESSQIHPRTKRERLEDFPAMIFQHEIDHSMGTNIYEKFLEINRDAK